MKKNTPKKPDEAEGIRITRSVVTIGKNRHVRLRIHCKPKSRIQILSRVKGIGMEWIVRAQTDAYFTPHKWTDWVPVKDIPAKIEYRAIYVPGYGKGKP